MENPDNQIRGNDGPRDERRGLVKIVDGTLIETHSALEHRGRVQRGGGEKQKIVRAVVRAKTSSPQKNRVGRTQAVKYHGEQKEMPVSEPSHSDSLNAEMDGASGNSAWDI